MFIIMLIWVGYGVGGSAPPVGCRNDLDTLKYFQSNLELVLNEEDHLYYDLTVLFGIESYEAYFRWCRKAKSLLSSK